MIILFFVTQKMKAENFFVYIFYSLLIMTEPLSPVRVGILRATKTYVYKIIQYLPSYGAFSQLLINLAYFRTKI